MRILSSGQNLVVRTFGIFDNILIYKWVTETPEINL